MRNISIRQVSFALLTSTALIAMPAIAAEYTVNSVTSVTNGNAANVIDGGDKLTITGSGSIDVSGTPGVVAINTSGDGNIITNDGSLLVEQSVGLVFAGSLNRVSNSGFITVKGGGTGITLAGDKNIIENSGIITIQGNGNGITSLSVSDVFNNSGSIIVQGDGAGIDTGGNDSKITNSGLIDVKGSGVGVRIAGEESKITNSGTIKTAGNNSKTILVENWGSRITNSGEIYALGSNGNAFEAEAGGIDTFFTNSGKVVSVEGNSFIFAGSDSQLSLLAPSFIGGAIDMGPGGNAVNITTGRSHSVLWAFPNVTPSIDNSSGVNGAWNAATNQFATIDPTALSASVDVSADMVAGASEIVRNNSTGGEFWLKAFGSYAEYGANGIYNDFNGVNAGIIGGASAQINKDFYAGAMLGYAISNLTVNSRWQTSQTINSGGAIGGFYAKSDIDNFYADFAIFGGFMNNDSSRLVNDNLALMGVDYANANYNSWFISPELRIGVDIVSDSEWTITPSVMARYSYQSIDGYTETGSNANATFGARAVQMIEGNVELAASKPLENGTLTIAGGLDYRQNISAGAINSTLIGQNLTIPVNNSALIVGYASANASFDMGDNMLFELNGRIGLGTNGYKAISGTIGISGKF